MLVLIVVVGYFMLVGGAGQAGSGVTEDVTQVISGVLVVALAGFSPWVALKVVHFTGDHAHQLHLMASTAATRRRGGRPNGPKGGDPGPDGGPVCKTGHLCASGKA